MVLEAFASKFLLASACKSASIKLASKQKASSTYFFRCNSNHSMELTAQVRSVAPCSAELKLAVVHTNLREAQFRKA